jgi:prepilin-type N-terminal cleavage/methylation domain-containing protein
MTTRTKSQLVDQPPNEIPRSIDAVARARDTRGHSLIELLIVVALLGVVTSLALPQLLVQRRLSRSVAVTREIMTGLRHTRQLAMNQRQAFTFQYNNTTKQISVIDHNSNVGAALLIDPSYPNTAGSQIVNQTPLAADALLSSEITYGIPAGLPAGALADGIAMTSLFNAQINITFQPDGSVIDGAGNPVGRAMFIYNNRAARATATAISVIGASGRVKIWRYDAVANVYAE